MTEEPTILTVGSEVKHIADFSKWDESYNIKGYEHVFLDFHSLAERLEDEDPDEKIHTSNNSAVMRAMTAGNQIFILLPDSNRINYGNEILPLDRIVPGDFSLVEETGKYVDLDSVASGWEWYFDRHFDWNLRLGVDSYLFKIDGEQLVLKDKSLIQNMSRESVA